jgi:hypothetical protein
MADHIYFVYVAYDHYDWAEEVGSVNKGVEEL